MPQRSLDLPPRHQTQNNSGLEEFLPRTITTPDPERTMGFLANVRYDLRLRNLTIYAQWTSVAAALLLYFPIVAALYIYVLFMANPQRMIWTGMLGFTLDIGPWMLLYPLPPLAVELPQYIRPKSLLYISMASWLVMPARYVYMMIHNMRQYGTNAGLSAALFKFHIVLLVPLNIAPLYVIRRLKRPGLPEFGARLGLNMLYFVWFLFPAFCSPLIQSCVQMDNGLCSFGYIGWLWASPIVIYLVAGFTFALAALLYGVARVRQHPWVSSTVLGGTGIEAVVLMLPGPGPSHESVGDEARIGAIRL